MKKTGSTTAVIILSALGIIVIVGSLLNLRTPSPATPTATATVFLTATSSQTPDPCAPEHIEATIVEFDKLSREFSDVFVLAQNTQAAQLAPLISKMQEIRRKAEIFAIPGCLSVLQEYQLGFMNTAIATSLLLYSSFPDNTTPTVTKEQIQKIVIQVNQNMAQANDYGNKYTAEMARLLGITLTPSSTSAPSSTPASAETTPAP